MIAAEDGAGVAEADARGSVVASDVGVNGFCDVLLDVIGGLKFFFAANFANKDDLFNIGIVFKKFKKIGEAAAFYGVAANANNIFFWIKAISKTKSFNFFKS